MPLADIAKAFFLPSITFLKKGANRSNGARQLKAKVTEENNLRNQKSKTLKEGGILHEGSDSAWRKRFSKGGLSCSDTLDDTCLPPYFCDADRSS
jgi:hypothetical protein